MTVYAALLRGINVGGNQKIKMAELKKSFEALGFSGVKTYIQSGNVLFAAEEAEEVLRDLIETRLAEDFGFAGKVILRSLDELKAIVAAIPYSASEIEARKSASGVECLYITLLERQPSEHETAKLSDREYGDDLYYINGRDIYLLFQNSIRNSKLAAQVEKLGILATTRNFNTIHKLIEYGTGIL